MSAAVARANERLEGEERADKVTEIVKYIVVFGRKSNTLKKATLKEHLFGKRTATNSNMWAAFPILLQLADTRLRRTFGLSINMFFSSDPKLYIRNALVNSIGIKSAQNDAPSKDVPTVIRSPNVSDAKLNGVIAAALSCIFMSGGEMSRGDFNAFLSELGIKRGERSVALRMSQDEVMKKMEQKGYVQRFSNVGLDGTQEIVQWGFVARCTVSRVAMLEMACALYADGRTPKDMPEFLRLAKQVDAEELQ